MILLVLIVLLCLSVLNHLVSRNILYPPFLFCITWFLSLTALALSGEAFYPVSAEALLVYMVGAVFFSIGGLYNLTVTKKNSPARSLGDRQHFRVHRILDIGLLVVIIGLPLYIMDIAKSVDLLDYYLLAALRKTNVEASASSQRSFSVLKNLVVLSTLVALAMHYENDGTAGRKWRSYLAIVVAVFYGVFTGSKGWVTIVPTLAFISIVAGKKVKISTLALVSCGTLVLFSAGLLTVNFIYGGVDDPFRTAQLLAETVRNYWVGGLVAFNRIVEAPESIAAVQSLGRFFLETANSFGASFEIPSIFSDYTQISSGEDTNTYTIYYTYYMDLGWFGVILGMFMLGFGLSWVHRYAERNHPIAIFVSGTAAMGILLSFHAEHFVLGLNYYIKLIAFYFLVYHVSTREFTWRRLSETRAGAG
jgi:oligosaccharide repeat unit polymerase